MSARSTAQHFVSLRVGLVLVLKAPSGKRRRNLGDVAQRRCRIQEENLRAVAAPDHLVDLQGFVVEVQLARFFPIDAQSLMSGMAARNPTSAITNTEAQACEGVFASSHAEDFRQVLQEGDACTKNMTGALHNDGYQEHNHVKVCLMVRVWQSRYAIRCLNTHVHRFALPKDDLVSALLPDT